MQVKIQNQHIFLPSNSLAVNDGRENEQILIIFSIIMKLSCPAIMWAALSALRAADSSAGRPRALRVVYPGIDHVTITHE